MVLIRRVRQCPAFWSCFEFLSQGRTAPLSTQHVSCASEQNPEKESEEGAGHAGLADTGRLEMEAGAFGLPFSALSHSLDSVEPSLWEPGLKAQALLLAGLAGPGELPAGGALVCIILFDCFQLRRLAELGKNPWDAATGRSRKW